MRSVDRAQRAGITPAAAGNADRLPGAPEDGTVLVVLILTVVFVMFMASVPLWFSGLIRSLAP